MSERLRSQVCLITGSSGIGAATAELAGREGACVFVCSNAEADCARLSLELSRQGVPCGFCVADLRCSPGVTQAVQACLSRFSRIDALFNVAGISGRRLGDGPIHECTEEGWDTILETNLRSVFLMCRAVISQMLTQEPGADGLRGAVLNMASVLAFSPESRFFATHAYAASKSAIIGLSRAMASYYAPFKIRINALAPGLVRTPMSVRAQSDAQIGEYMKTKQALAEDLLEPEAVARAAVFLMSSDSASITGDVLTVDGGWTVTG
ncbi:MAG: SDR family oxidoreductase [Acidobacteriota bacterium]